jgi:pimeloyl-ACP methyl ester carboxylesterase
MNKQLHIIYIPGLGRGDYRGQRQAISLWRFWGVEAELFPSNWGDKQPWQPKLDRLLARVDELVAEGKRVGLVGVSAGGSAAINVYAARQDAIVGVVGICGWINYPQDINPIHFKINPAFVASARQCQESLNSLDGQARRRIQSRYAVIDKVVSRPHSRIDGANNRLLPSIGHGFTIVTQILFGAPGFIRFLKRQARSIK